MNVRVVHPDPEDATLDQAVAVCDEARRTQSPYLVHDAEPLGAVARAWVRYFDQTAPMGELEVAVAETLTRWSARSVDLPDYYFVVDSEHLDVTERHWFFGVLASSAPTRVVATSAAGITKQLGELQSGRWWPPLDQLSKGSSTSCQTTSS